jgi:hypothetical protein
MASPAYTELVMAEYVLGRSAEQISSAVSTTVKRDAEYNKQREEINAKAGIAVAERQAVPDSGAASGRNY